MTKKQKFQAREFWILNFYRIVSDFEIRISDFEATLAWRLGAIKFGLY